MKNIKVGMKIYVIPVGANNTRSWGSRKFDVRENISEKEVTKVGRKYFYLDGEAYKYEIDTLFHSCENHYDMQGFLRMDDLLEHLEIKRLKGEINSIVSSVWRIVDKMSSEDVRVMAELLKKYE